MKKVEKYTSLSMLWIISDSHLAPLIKAEQTLRKPHTLKSLPSSRRENTNLDFLFSEYTTCSR